MGEKLTIIAVFMGVGLVFTWLSLLAMLAFARVVNLAVVKGNIGFGPKLFRPFILGAPIEVCLMPHSCWIQVYPIPYPPDGDPRYDAVATSVAAGERRAWSDLGLGARGLFVAIVFLVAATLALIALGPTKGAECMLDDLVMVVRGTFGPFSTARTAFDAALRMLHEQGAFALARRSTATLCAAQLLAIVTNLQMLPRDQTKPSPLRTKLTGLAFLLVLLLCCTWLVAFVAWLFA